MVGLLNHVSRKQPISATQTNRLVDAVNSILQTSTPKTDLTFPVNQQPKDATGKPIVAAVSEFWQEISRITVPVRIYDPSDHTIYVDVDRIASVTFAKPDGAFITLNFNTS